MRLKNLLILTMIAILAPLGAMAQDQMPPMINYQGHLTDDLGAPITGTVAMTFSIYDAAGGGVVIWTETYPTVNIFDGGFSVILGEANPLGPDIFNSADRWLEIVVDGQPIVPRTRFTSMPYAHKVGSIEGAEAGSLTGDFSVTPPAKNDFMGGDKHTGIPMAEVGTGFSVYTVAGRPGSMHLLDANTDIMIDLDGQDTTVAIGTAEADANLHVNGDIYTLGGNGDIDLSGSSNIIDITQYLNYFFMGMAINEEQYANADIDGDGRLNYDDLAMLIREKYGLMSKADAVKEVHAIYGASYSTGLHDAFYVNEKAGIATPDPAANLHVNGNVYTLGGEGDIDVSGSFDIADLSKYIDYLYMNGTLTEEEYAHGDIDGDGRLTVDDMTLATLLYNGQTKEDAIRKVHGSYGSIINSSADAFYVRGDLGVGTNGPAEKLHVFWDVDVDAELGRGDTDPAITFLSLRNTNGTKCYIYPDPTGTVLIVSQTKP